MECLIPVLIWIERGDMKPIWECCLIKSFDYAWFAEAIQVIWLSQIMSRLFNQVIWLSRVCWGHSSHLIEPDNEKVVQSSHLIEQGSLRPFKSFDWAGIECRCVTLKLTWKEKALGRSCHMVSHLYFHYLPFTLCLHLSAHFFFVQYSSSLSEAISSSLLNFFELIHPT